MRLNSFNSFEECSQSCPTMDPSSTNGGGEITPLEPEPPAPVPQFFSCYDGTYLPAQSVCNGVRECANGEDEFNCFGPSNGDQE